CSSSATTSTPTTTTTATAGGGAPPVRPGPNQFRSGTCSAAAPTVVAVGDLATRLRGVNQVSTVDRNALESQQNELRRLHTSPEFPRPVADLVPAIGFVRLRLASHSYDARLMDSVLTAEQQLVRRCVSS